MGFVKTSHPPYTFTQKQYDGLLAASLSATIISLLASFAGLLVHFLLLWYDRHRPDDDRYNSVDNSKALVNKGNGTIPFEQNSGTIGFNNRRFSSTQQQHQYTCLKKDTSTGTMNRVSLRLIVVACLSYSVYSVAQLVVTGIAEKVLACRVLAYFIISFDVMGSICLGLVGFNLVMVFVVNVRRPERLEKYYYAASIIISIFVFVPPLVLKAGRTMDQNDSCWYHFFFEGRKANPFNWLYYYSWLLFASILATVSSIIAIRKVIIEKNNFAHTINMLNREEQSYSRPAMHTIPSSNSTHSQDNIISTQRFIQPKTNMGKTSELFRRVAIRCICYALVPVLCKSWGIGIEIAITSGIVVNYPILVVDRFMACIMGFFVSCIYFSDPSVQIVWQDMMMDYKKRYVDQFYYADVSKVVHLHVPSNDGYTGICTSIKQQREQHIYTIVNYSPPAVNKSTHPASHSGPIYLFASALRQPVIYHPSIVFRFNAFLSRLFRRSQTSEEEDSDTQDISCHGWCCLFCHNTQELSTRKEKACWVPMRRVNETPSISRDNTMASTNSIQNQHLIESIEESMNQTNASYVRDSINSYYKSYPSRILEPYPNPIQARLLNWFFAKVILYRPPYYRIQKQRFKAQQMKGKDNSKKFMNGDNTTNESNQDEKLAHIDSTRRMDIPNSSRSVTDYTTTMLRPVKLEQLSSFGTDSPKSKHVQLQNRAERRINVPLFSNNKTTAYKDQPSSSLTISNNNNSQSSPCILQQEKAPQPRTGAVCESTSKKDSSYPLNASCIYTQHLTKSLQASTRIELERKRKAKEMNGYQLKEVSPLTTERVFLGSKLPLKGRKSEREATISSLSQTTSKSSAPPETLTIPCASKLTPPSSVFLPLVSSCPSSLPSLPRYSSHYSRRPVVKQGYKDSSRHQAEWHQKEYRYYQQHNPQSQSLNAKQHGAYERNSNQAHRLYMRHHMNMTSLDEPPKLRGGNGRPQWRRSKNEGHNASFKRIPGYGNNYYKDENGPRNDTGDVTHRYLKAEKKVINHNYIESNSTLIPADYSHPVKKRRQRFFVEEGLSPPSKRHYAYIYHRIVSQKSRDAPVASVARLSNPQTRAESEFQQGIEKTDSLTHGRHHTNKTRARNKESGVSSHDNQFHCEAAQEIMHSGVRTVLLHISNDMNFNAKKDDTDDQKQDENNRITVRIYAWVTDFTVYRYPNTPNLIHYF